MATSSVYTNLVLDSDEVEHKVGSDLMADALSLFKDAKAIVVCRVIAVYCKKDLVKFYERFGFKVISNVNPATKLYRMTLISSDKNI